MKKKVKIKIKICNSLKNSGKVQIFWKDSNNSKLHSANKK
jgi:hypothetical protein